MNRCSGSLAKVGHWRFAGPPVLFVSAVCLPSPSLRFPPLPLLASPSRDSSPLSSRTLFLSPPAYGERRGGVGVSAAGVVWVVSRWRFCMVRTVASLSGRPRIAPRYETCTRQCNFHTRDREKVSGEREKFPGSPFRATWKLLVAASQRVYGS